MRILIVLLSLLMVSCGSGGGSSHPNSTPSPVTPPSAEAVKVPVKLLPMKYNQAHYTYIIGGQSNGVRLLYSVSGINSDIDTDTSDLVAGNALNVNGYGVGGTGIDFWLDPANSAPLKNVVTNLCNQNPYFIWYQGESDGGNLKTGEPGYLTYQDRLFTFFNELITICPNIAIIEIGIAVQDTIINNYHWNEIMKIQKNLNIPYVDANPHGVINGYVGGNHLNQAGYQGLWNEITTKYPL